MSQFVHLHIHTEYSIVDGIVRIKPLMARVAENKMPAAAITDRSNLFGMVKFYQAALQAGIKPIVGVEVWVNVNTETPVRLILLCQNDQGYRNITQLISRAYLENQQDGKAIIKKAWLQQQQASAGLIALSGAREGDIGQALLSHDSSRAQTCLREWLSIFPNRFYIELQRTGRAQEETYIQAILPLAVKFQVPVVATNAVRFLDSADFDAHEARVCIYQGNIIADPRRPRIYSPEQHLRTAEEMMKLFADIPQALRNTIEITKRCNVQLTLGATYLPNFPIPNGMSAESYIEQQTNAGLERVLAIFYETDATNNEKKAIYRHRLQYELDTIKTMGFVSYFLIVADFIQWAKMNDIPVGPGRGSGVGSLVAYVLGITNLDPIQHNLLFERFLNPERVSLPDFDIDLCMEGRDRVIDYVAEKYGRHAVSQIITYGSMAAKAVIRDVGRVLGYPYGFVDQLAKLIPFELGMTLKKALQQEDKLLTRYQNEEEVKAIIDLGIKLEGLTRNIGKHAGGVVIAPSALTDFTPLYCEPGGENLVTQLDKDDVEKVGLVKFDFLGLRTLTIIHWAVRQISAQIKNQNNKTITHQAHKPTANMKSTAPQASQKQTDELNIDAIPLDDLATFQMLKTCSTTAVFQIESRGMKDLVKRLQPDCFDDIVALLSLFRPGPLQSGMVDDYINRKHGRAPVLYPHPSLEAILRPTYGVMLYQEQVMQIAQELAGYTLGNADLLRRAMGKKKPEEMAKQRAIFVEGAVKKNVAGQVANHIFDLIEKFAGYGFNRSHSAAYALLSYQTAWLKTHYPSQYMAAVLSSDLDATEKIVRLLEDCRTLNLKILPPNINRSGYRFVADDDEIIYGLGAIKGVGEAAITHIMQVREEGGAFTDLFSLCRRVEIRKVNRRVLEAFIRSGALDVFNVHRASLLASVDLALHAAEQHQRSQTEGQYNLFEDDELQDSTGNGYGYAPAYVPTEPWTDLQRLQAEKESLGYYLNGHPIANDEQELAAFITAPLAQLQPQSRKTVIGAGYIVALRNMQTKSGNRMAVLTIEDRSGKIDVLAFSEVFQAHRDLLIKDQLIIVEGEVSVDNFTNNYRIIAQSFYDLAQARNQFAKKLIIKLYANDNFSQQLQTLKTHLQPYCDIKNKCPVHIIYHKANASAEFALGKNWKVHLSTALTDTLKSQDSQVEFQIIY